MKRIISIICMITFLIVGLTLIFFVNAGRKNTIAESKFDVIIEDLKKSRSEDLKSLANAIKDKYNLKANDEISIHYYVAKEDSLDQDITIHLYNRPFGPTKVYSLNSDEFFYEE